MMSEKEARAFITQVASSGYHGLLPPAQATSHDKNKLWILLASSSSNSRNRGSGNTTVNSWNSTWLLCIIG